MRTLSLVAVFLLLVAGCTRKSDLPVYKQVSSFALLDQQGKTYTLANLRGKVWVANFIFTRCAGPCPRMSGKMKELAAGFTGDEVRFISFTIDPDYDKPPVLAEYAKRFGAVSGRWVFLTGERAELQKLGRASFMLNDVDGSMQHATQFALVDRAGRIRGYYMSEHVDQMQLLRSHITELLKESE